MSTKYTPAPWVLKETKHEKIISSWDVQIGDLHEVNVFPYKRIYSEDRKQSGLIVDSQKMADARLIAAAPELLEVLQVLLIDVRALTSASLYFKESIPLAEKAIAKALGQQT